jgi:hypothetical protein
MTTQITDYQEKLNQQFLDFCNQGNLEGIKRLVEQSISAKESKFRFFKKLFKKEDPIIDFFADDSKGLKALSQNGDFAALDYLHSSPLFIEELTNKETNRIPSYFDCFVLAGSNGHIQCAELLAPHINAYENYLLSVYLDFRDACGSGDLNAVKFLVETPLLTINASCLINGAYSEMHPQADAFTTACEAGHLNIVQYFTSDPTLTEKIDLELIDEGVYIPNQKIIEHFIFDLNLPEDHSFLRLIYTDDEDDDIVEKLLKIREDFKELSSELEISPTSSKSPKIKKI